MRTAWKSTGIALATAAAVLAVAGSAAAAQGAGAGTCGGGQSAAASAGQGRGQGMGQGRGQGMGQRIDIANLASGSLTADQRTALAAAAAEEKLAHDVYVALAARYPDTRQFSRIAGAETRHLEALRTLMVRYDIADPTAGLAAGDFSDPALAASYQQFLDGATTVEAALEAGVAVEKADISLLTTAAASVTAPDVQRVYESLTTASQRHLAAFGG